MRTIRGYILLYLKGLAMGAADIIPGVSGGTIAFISGIYEELLESISAIKPSLVTTYKTEGVKGVWRTINGNFLMFLFAGVLTSIFTLAKLIEYFLHHQPILLWAFFFGLIIASIFYIGKEIKRWGIWTIVAMLLGAAFIVYLSVMPPLSPNANKLFLFFAGMIAICAMILPGISGSFILLILGAYGVVIESISDRNVLNLVAVGAGCIVGLLLFSNLLKWLLKKYHQVVIAVLTGFLIGSLWKIWPWKKDVLVYNKEEGVQQIQEITTDFESLSAYLTQQPAGKFEQYKSYVEQNILPTTYEQLNGVSSQLWLSLLFCILGFSVIFILERIAVNKKNV